MHLLSPTEARDLTEHLHNRDDIWLYQNDYTWIRAHSHGNPPYYLAVHLRRASNGMSLLTTKSVTWSPETAMSYIDWLLDHYTTYTRRQLLRDHLIPYVSNGCDTHTLSYKLFDLAHTTNI